MSTKSYPTKVVLTLTTGRLLCNFSDMHEMCEWLDGGPIFTHQFASKSFVNNLRMKVFSQHPRLLEVKASEIDKENWQIKRAEYIKKFGSHIELTNVA